MQITLITTAALLISQAFAAPTATGNSTVTRTGLAPQVSPQFPNLHVSSDALYSYNTGILNVSETLSRAKLNLKNYPEPWSSPDVTHPEIVAAVKAINWDFVPKISVRDSHLDTSKYDDSKDTDCWWTSSGCLKPKVNYLPEDVSFCPRKGEWGLTYDDGPFNFYDDDEKEAKTENKYAEPQLYNYLAEQNLKSTLFYIGSNVANYPAAARRALSDGHYLCVHTWSHPVMTAQSNEKAVAELYWTLKAIKEATGVTPKCWRPPQGDVDDRIRSIAWQMGLRTVIWDRDTKDWDMPAPGGGKLSPKKVDKKFGKWIKEEANMTHGSIVLEHELNHATVEMTEKWIPELKKTFKIVPALACNDITKPYWETSFEYPSIHNSTTN